MTAANYLLQKYAKSTRRRLDTGFTLIELIVVVVIVGILTAIAAPSIINQSSAAKATAAKQRVNTVNKTQQTYYAQNGTFANTFDLLATGVLKGGTTAVTEEFIYTLADVSNSRAAIGAQPFDTAIYAYTGGILRFTNSSQQIVVASSICQSTMPGGTVPTSPAVFNTSSVDCPTDFQSLKP
jgi:type IV pilus assembly protein PilA